MLTLGKHFVYLLWTFLHKLCGVVVRCNLQVCQSVWANMLVENYANFIL